MTFAARNDKITLALGGAAVRLRPSLRAATHFVRAEGFTDLPRRIAEFHLGTIRELITITATDRQEAAAFLTRIETTPLRIVADSITAPILALIAGFIPASDEKAQPSDRKAKPMPWPKVYRELFRKATGWLGWTPEAAWNATPTEINEAFAGHIAKLKAIHGSPDQDADQQEFEAYTPEQMSRIEELGYDPAFDREALSKLRAKIAGKS